MLKLQLRFVRVILEHLHQTEQIKVEPSVAMVKDLLSDNIDGHVITSVMKLLELTNPILKIRINPLLVCPLSQLK